jgi:hypothetical protein
VNVLTVAVTAALLEVSATLVATTWYIPSVAGAVYLPEESTLPPRAPSCTDHVTAVGCPAVVPLTVAVNMKLALGAIARLGGKIDTATIGTATITVALSIFEVSATLVATMWKVPVEEGPV